MAHRTAPTAAPRGCAAAQAAGAWPRGASRLPLAASPHLTGWPLASLLPSPAPRFARAVQPPAVPACLPAAAALPAAVAPGPRQPGQSLVAVLPGRASRELDAPPPAAAPPMRDMDGWIVDHWIGIGLSCLFVQLGLAALGFRV